MAGSYFKYCKWWIGIYWMCTWYNECSSSCNKWNICSIRENGLKDLKIPNVLKVYYGKIKAKKVINDDEVYVYPEYESAKEISLKF